MRVIAAFFGLYAPEVRPSHISVFSYDVKRVNRCTQRANGSKRKILLHGHSLIR